jgi:hypothetical protein
MIIPEDYEKLADSTKKLPIFTQDLCILHSYVLHDIPNHRLNERLSSLIEWLTNIDTDEKIELLSELCRVYPFKQDIQNAFDKLVKTL